MHEIDIPAEVIESCIRFRGRRHAVERLDPARLALVVIDMQNAWVAAGLSPLEIPMTRAIIPNINRLTAATRAAGGLVAWTQSIFPAEHTQRVYETFGTPEWCDRIVADTAIGAPGHEIHREMDVAGEDIRVVKTRPSAFIQGSSDLEDRLRAQGRDIIVITGTLTNACCESSARDAAALGFLPIMVQDAMATRTDAEHNATLINMMQLTADVRSCDDVLALLAAGPV